MLKTLELAKMAPSLKFKEGMAWMSIRFEDQKQEIGLDQWEGRRYLGLKRHLIISCISYLFPATVREKLRKKIRS